MSATRPSLAQAAVKALAPHYTKMEQDRPVEKYNLSVFVDLLTKTGAIVKKGHILGELSELKDEKQFASYIQTLDNKDLLNTGNMKNFIKALARSLKTDEKLDDTIQAIAKIIYPDTFEGNFHKILADFLLALTKHDYELKIACLKTQLAASTKAFDTFSKATEEIEHDANEEIEKKNTEIRKLTDRLAIYKAEATLELKLQKQNEQELQAKCARLLAKNAALVAENEALKNDAKTMRAPVEEQSRTNDSSESTTSTIIRLPSKGKGLFSPPHKHVPCTMTRSQSKLLAQGKKSKH